MAPPRQARPFETEHNDSDTQETEHRVYHFEQQFDNQRVPSGLVRALTEPSQSTDLRTPSPPIPVIVNPPAPKRKGLLSWIFSLGQLRARGHGRDGQRSDTPTKSEISDFVYVPHEPEHQTRRASTFPVARHIPPTTHHVSSRTIDNITDVEDGGIWHPAYRLPHITSSVSPKSASDRFDVDGKHVGLDQPKSDSLASELDKIEGLTVDSGYFSQRTGPSESLGLPIRKYSQNPPDSLNTDVEKRVSIATDVNFPSSVGPHTRRPFVDKTSEIGSYDSVTNKIYQEAPYNERRPMREDRRSWHSVASSLPIANDELFADIFDEPPVGVEDSIFYTSYIGEQFQVVESLAWLKAADLETASVNDRQIVEKRKRDLAPVLILSASGEPEDSTTFESVLDPNLPSRSLGHSIADWLLRIFARSWLELSRLIALTNHPVAVSEFYLAWGYVHLNAIIYDNWFVDINLTVPYTGKSTGQQSVKPSIRPSMSSTSQDVPYFYQQIFARDSDIDSGDVEVYQLSRNLSMPGSVDQSSKDIPSTVDDDVYLDSSTTSRAHSQIFTASTHSKIL